MANSAEQPKKSWFKGLKAEWNKIFWPDKTTLSKQTFAVVIVSIITGCVIVLVDTLAKYGIELLVR